MISDYEYWYKEIWGKEDEEEMENFAEPEYWNMKTSDVEDKEIVENKEEKEESKFHQIMGSNGLSVKILEFLHLKELLLVSNVCQALEEKYRFALLTKKLNMDELYFLNVLYKKAEPGTQKLFDNIDKIIEGKLNLTCININEVILFVNRDSTVFQIKTLYYNIYEHEGICRTNRYVLSFPLLSKGGGDGDLKDLQRVNQIPEAETTAIFKFELGIPRNPSVKMFEDLSVEGYVLNRSYINFMIEEGSFDKSINSLCKFILRRQGIINFVHDPFNRMGWNPFLSAIHFGNEDIVKFFIKEGVVIDMLNMMEHGTKKSENIILSMLVESREFLTLRKENGDSYLHVASELGLSRVCEYLVTEGILDVNDQNEMGDTPLHLASTVRVGKVLVENCADLNKRNNFDQTPLHYAVNRINEPLCRFLVEYGSDLGSVDDMHRNVLHFLATCEENFSEKRSKKLLSLAFYLVEECGMDIDTLDVIGYFPIYNAVHFSHFDLAAYFINQGCWFNEDDWGENFYNVLARCCSHPLSFEFFRVLFAIKYPTKEDQIALDNNQYLRLCCQSGNVAIVTFLLQFGEHLNYCSANKRDGKNCLHFLCSGRSFGTERERKEIADLLYRFYPDQFALALNREDREREFPVQKSLSQDNYLLSSYLFGRGSRIAYVPHGIEKTMLDSSLSQCVRYSCSTGRVDAVRFLVKNGADIHPPQVALSPIELAADEGFDEVVFYLLEVYEVENKYRLSKSFRKKYGEFYFRELTRRRRAEERKKKREEEEEKKRRRRRKYDYNSSQDDDEEEESEEISVGGEEEEEEEKDEVYVRPLGGDKKLIVPLQREKKKEEIDDDDDDDYLDTEEHEEGNEIFSQYVDGYERSFWNEINHNHDSVYNPTTKVGGEEKNNYTRKQKQQQQKQDKSKKIPSKISIFDDDETIENKLNPYKSNQRYHLKLKKTKKSLRIKTKKRSVTKNFKRRFVNVDMLFERTN